MSKYPTLILVFPLTKNKFVGTEGLLDGISWIIINFKMLCLSAFGCYNRVPGLLFWSIDFE